MYSIFRSLFLVTSLLSLVVSCGGGSDTTVPEIDSFAPLAAEVNVARNKAVTVVFSESMNGATINTSTFTLKDSSGIPVAGGVAYSGVTATLTPTAQLDNSEPYTATITTGVEDTSGNGLAHEFSWSFTTASGSIQISWSGNLEAAVNSNGGGYKVFYSSISGFNPGDAGVTEIDVPFNSGVSAPTSVFVSLSPGIYFIRLAAYSALDAPGTISGSSSTATAQITLNAP